MGSCRTLNSSCLFNMQHSNMVEVDRGCTQRITVRGFVEVESVEDMVTAMVIGDAEW